MVTRRGRLRRVLPVNVGRKLGRRRDLVRRACRAQPRRRAVLATGSHHGRTRTERMARATRRGRDRHRLGRPRVDVDGIDVARAGRGPDRHRPDAEGAPRRPRSPVDRASQLRRLRDRRVGAVRAPEGDVRRDGRDPASRFGGELARSARRAGAPRPGPHRRSQPGRADLPDGRRPDHPDGDPAGPEPDPELRIPGRVRSRVLRRAGGHLRPGPLPARQGAGRARPRTLVEPQGLGADARCAPRRSGALRLLPVLGRALSVRLFAADGGPGGPAIAPRDPPAARPSGQRSRAWTGW